MALDPYSGIPIYQAAPRAAVNPLDSLIQGFQQGNALQQLPQQMRNDQINQMLQQALLREKVLDLQDPNRAVAREIQQQLAKTAATPYSGVTYDPAAAALGAIAQPGTVTIDDITGAKTQATPRGPDIIPMGTSGFMFNEAVPLQAAQRKQDNAIALLQAKADAAGQDVQYVPTLDGGISVLPKSVKKGTTPTAAPVLGTDGTPIKAAPKGNQGGKRGMTEGQQANLTARWTKAGGTEGKTIEDFKNEDGSLDSIRLGLAVGEAEFESGNRARDAKLGAVPAANKEKVSAYQAVQKDLERLRLKLDQELASGDIPSGLQDVISGSLSDAPSNFLTRAYQRFILQPMQTKTAAENERLRGAVSASIGRAIAGAALTGTEKQNLIPFTPQAGDSFERLLEKSSALEQFLANQIEGLSIPFKPNTQPAQGSATAPSGSATPAKGRFKVISTGP